jgi:hypothetical protein
MFIAANGARAIAMNIIYQDNKKTLDEIGNLIRKTVKDDWRKRGITYPTNKLGNGINMYLKYWGYEVDILDDNEEMSIISW